MTDAAIAAALGGLALLNLWVRWPRESQLPVPAALMLVALLFLPLAWLRRFPLAVLAVVTVASILFGTAGLPGAAWSGIALWLGFYSAGAYGNDRWRSVARGLAAVVVVGYAAYLDFLPLLTTNQEIPAGQQLGSHFLAIIDNIVILIWIWLWGDATHLRLKREAELAERTRQLEHERLELAERTRQLESEREENARRAVIDERVRIARELHDVVAHHVSLMGVQAGAARRVLAQKPDKAEEALAAIEATSREAVRELHRLLGFMRGEGDEDSLAPQPTVRQLDALVGQMREAGLPVQLIIEGKVRPLPPGVDLSAYRIVQEALTNTLKHAGPATARVTVQYGEQALEIEVTDDGRRAAPNVEPVGGGNGLLGMRERVSLLNGQLQVGHRPEMGFQVRARLPLDGGAP